MIKIGGEYYGPTLRTSAWILSAELSAKIPLNSQQRLQLSFAKGNQEISGYAFYFGRRKSTVAQVAALFFRNSKNAKHDIVADIMLCLISKFKNDPIM